jgi:hypothetical protein
MKKVFKYLLKKLFIKNQNCLSVDNVINDNDKKTQNDTHSTLENTSSSFAYADIVEYNNKMEQINKKFYKQKTYHNRTQLANTTGYYNTVNGASALRYYSLKGGIEPYSHNTKIYNNRYDLFYDPYEHIFENNAFNVTDFTNIFSNCNNLNNINTGNTYGTSGAIGGYGIPGATGVIGVMNTNTNPQYKKIDEGRIFNEEDPFGEENWNN